MASTMQSSSPQTKLPALKPEALAYRDIKKNMIIPSRDKGIPYQILHHALCCRHDNTQIIYIVGCWMGNGRKIEELVP
jgi:hypothetical protein